MKIMDEKTKQGLRDAGREDLIEIHEITQAGYAGVMPNGNIVDRRYYPEAISISKNTSLGIPEPKEVELRPFDLTEIDDVRIIIMVKDKDYAIFPKDVKKREECKMIRILVFRTLLETHGVCSTALQDIK